MDYDDVIQHFNNVLYFADDAPSGVEIITECLSIADLLVKKNSKYGNSALDPVRIFSQADATEQIKVRIDDKLKRLQNDHESEDEDIVLDLIGYLILLRIAQTKKFKPLEYPDAVVDLLDTNVIC